MGEDSERITAVKIYNRTYQVRSGGDPEYVRQLAQYVDERMTEVFELTPTVDSLKVAILAALNIADEYFSAKQKLNTLEDAVAEGSEKMIGLLEPFDGAESP